MTMPDGPKWQMRFVTPEGRGKKTSSQATDKTWPRISQANPHGSSDGEDMAAEIDFSKVSGQLTAPVRATASTVSGWPR